MICAKLNRTQICPALVFAVTTSLMFGDLQAQAMSTTHFFYDSISDVDLEFDAPTSPTPSSFTGGSFSLANLSVFEDGGGPDTTNEIEFYSSAEDGGFSTFNLTSFTNAFGAQLWSGTTEMPTFVNGDYEMLGGTQPGSAVIGTMHITTPAAAVAEPATVVLMGLGLVGLGVAWRRKRVS